ncbi:YHS domain-containing (seleno)protein [Psychromonas sp. PT13]|uniref:YHS domain-containing (seleno)protein n=1 Tax=Psychromonas sp. PT13 TaxID=3439547 RepID=UPI003EC11898
MKKLMFLLFLFSSSVFAADAIYTPWHNNLAIRGYDTVAYFTENAPVKGKKAHSMEWQGATWRFSSNENLALFKANPEKYAPQYGGYCAYAVANGSLASIEPEQFTILNDKLYLNYNADVQQQWLEKRDAYIELADKKWPSILND